MYTLEEILKLVNESNTFTRDEQRAIALMLPITVCSLYCLNMKKLYNITVAI